MPNYGIGSVLTPKTRPITAEYERGYESTLGRHCRTKGCPSDMAKEPAEALWCARCKRDEELDHTLDAIAESWAKTIAHQNQEVLRELVASEVGK